jgi:hypothetical protein
MAKPPEWLSADIQEFYSLCGGTIKAIQRAILEKRGQPVVPYMTISNRMDDLGLERPRKKSKQAKGKTMPELEPVEVHPDQMPLIKNADTPADVHHGAVHEFIALPDGYAKEIQPMRPYTAAEEWALNKSMELYGFLGTIVRDQYGRILDGNQRSRVAHQRGIGAPFTITQVRDDAHAMEIARTFNSVKRYHTLEQRQEMAVLLRDQGFSFREIAVALDVSKDTVQRDVFGAFKVIPASEPEPPVSNETPHPDFTDAHVSSETIASDDDKSPVSNETPQTEIRKPLDTTPPPVSNETPISEKRIRGRDGKSYPAKRSNGTRAPKIATTEKELSHVIDYLMRHALQWHETDWQGFLQVVEQLTASRQSTPPRQAMAEAEAAEPEGEHDAPDPDTPHTEPGEECVACGEWEHMGPTVRCERCNQFIHADCRKGHDTWHHEQERAQPTIGQ